MGADLYVERIVEKARAAAEPKFNAAVKKRNAYRLKHPVETKFCDEKHNEWLGKPADLANCKVCQLQAEVHRWHDAMYPDDGYFRDSYNATGFLSRFGYSWWQDVIPMLNQRGNLTPDKARELRDMVASAQLRPVTAESLRASGGTVDDGENSVESWNTFYLEKRERFLAFLTTAIKNRDRIHCSL